MAKKFKSFQTRDKPKKRGARQHKKNKKYAIAIRSLQGEAHEKFLIAYLYDDFLFFNFASVACIWKFVPGSRREHGFNVRAHLLLSNLGFGSLTRS